MAHVSMSRIMRMDRQNKYANWERERLLREAAKKEKAEKEEKKKKQEH